MSAARRFFSGDTEAQAVIDAAGHFGLGPGELAYRLIDKKHGFLRRPKVVIEVDPDNPRRAATAPLERPAAITAAAPPSPPAARSIEVRPDPATERGGTRRPDWTHQEALGGAVAGLDGAVAAAEAVVALSGLRLVASGVQVPGPEGDELRIELAGADREALVARQGELLRACEYLVRRMVLDLPAGGLLLDSGGFRAQRVDTLRRRAVAAAEEVRRSGEAVLFEPLPASERRIVHLAVEAEPGVASASEGEGDRRSVRVFPTGARPGNAAEP